MYLPTLPPTRDQSSCRTSSSRLEKRSICVFTSRPVITQKEMARLNVPTRHSNNISGSTIITNRTIGLNSFPWQNLLIIMHRVLRPEYHCSSLTKAIILTSQSTLNVISHQAGPVTMQSIWTRYTNISVKKWLMPRNVIKGQPTLDTFWPWTSK